MCIIESVFWFIFFFSVGISKYEYGGVWIRIIFFYGVYDFVES